MKIRKGLYLVKGKHRRAAIRNKKQKNLKEEEPKPNQEIFGVTLGSKTESDNVKIGNIGEGNRKQIRFVRTGTDEDLGERLRKINFKEKKARNNIALKI